MRIRVPGTDATLTYVEDLMKTGSDAFDWTLAFEGQERHVRIYVSPMADWILNPSPESETERRRAIAQLAITDLAAAMKKPKFFDDKAEYDVKLTSFGTMSWDPNATPDEDQAEPTKR